MDLSRFFQTFFEESLEGLDAMESYLLSLDLEAPDRETIHALFRAAHSIKGAAATFGFQEVTEVTHILETLLDEVREGRRRMTPDLVDVLLSSVDVLRGLIQAHQAGHTPPPEMTQEIQAALQGMLDRPCPSRVEGSGPPGAPETASPDSGAQGPDQVWRIRFRPDPHLLETGNDPLRILKALEDLGTIEVTCDASNLPSLPELHPTGCYLAWDLILKGGVSLDAIQEIFEWVEGDCELQIESLGQAEATAPAPSQTIDSHGTSQGSEDSPSRSTPTRPVQTAGTPSLETGSIRVSTEKIDALVNMVGELVITQSMLMQIGKDLAEANPVATTRLIDGLEQLANHLHELRDRVMQIRMLPIRFAFQRFPRMVRDLSRRLGKEIHLEWTGEQTELDKTVLEKIVDPLVHLVRNALDHGIEPPEVREALGKPRAGRIHLHAYHHGGHILIEVRDDGAGLNRARILAKAREKGLLPPGEDPNALPDEAVWDLIFQPGFSTAESVSDLSGRGVGMDVVRRNIRALGGEVEVSTRPGEGSTFTIRLPLTLAILDGQLVRVAGQIFVIPLAVIVESLVIQEDQVASVAGCPGVYLLRGQYLPILPLDEVFHLRGSGSAPLAGRLLVVAEGPEGWVGLVVDELLDQQQVVIKSLDQNFRPVEGISGATILGDGRVALILDVPGVVSLARKSLGHRRPGVQPVPQ